MWIKENRSGKWPSWEPMRNRREDVKSIPFTPPKVERATNIGTIQANEPKVLLPKDLKQMQIQRGASLKCILFLQLLLLRSFLVRHGIILQSRRHWRVHKPQSPWVGLSRWHEEDSYENQTKTDLF